MTTIIDYGMGNIGSIQNMLKKIGHTAEITTDSQNIMEAQRIILPGVGAFDKAMSNLSQLGLIEVIQSKARTGTPLLGICLGMQLLAESSEEGVLPGLNLVPGKVLRMLAPVGHKIPHMGWNVVQYDEVCPLYRNFHTFEEASFYFVHTYHFVCTNEECVTGQTPYGSLFISSVGKNNIYGVQFHPEKSHKYGMQLLKNFIELT